MLLHTAHRTASLSTGAAGKPVPNFPSMITRLFPYPSDSYSVRPNTHTHSGTNSRDTCFLFSEYEEVRNKQIYAVKARTVMVLTDDLQRSLLYSTVLNTHRA